MIVKLYHNYSDNHHVEKNITLLDSIEGALRDSCSVLEPTITIEWYGNISSLNYIHIPDFNRYYFVVNIVSIRKNLWSLSCHVDVLMSYREGIKKCGGIIARQEFLYNLYLNDDEFLIDSPRMFTNIEFPRRLSPADNFVLTLAGGPK